MALNVEQITNRLAQMPDAALQKYAAMNKNDPYIVALAVSESNRRKQMRQAAQGAQGQMPQPKVVDAAVQGMAAPMPEDVGIARLPAGDMNFADGGIVAFAEGGGVERYNGAYGSLTGEVQRVLQKSPYERTPEENALLQQAGVALQSRSLPSDSGIAGANTFLQNLGPNIRNYFTAGASKLSDEELARQPSAGGAMNERILRGLGIAPSQPGASTPIPPYAQEKEPWPTAAATSNLPVGADRLGEAPTLNVAADKTAPKADTTQRPAAPGLDTNTSDLQALYKRLQGPADKELTELRNQREVFSSALQDFAKKELSDFEKEEAKKGDVFKGRQERLAQQEAKLEGMKDQNLGLALLQAGAAMMSTPGGLGVALGKGVNAGTERYVAGIDKLNAAQDRLMDAKDRLEELRINRDDMTAKERRALTSQINKSVLEGKKLFLDGAEKDLGYRREDVKTLFSGIVTDMASQRSAGATVQAAKIKADETRNYLENIRGGSLVETARKNIMADIIKANPYADEATRQRLFQAEWAKALQNNPALAQYAGGASGGGGASSSDPLGLR